MKPSANITFVGKVCAVSEVTPQSSIKVAFQVETPEDPFLIVVEFMHSVDDIKSTCVKDIQVFVNAYNIKTSIGKTSDGRPTFKLIGQALQLPIPLLIQNNNHENVQHNTVMESPKAPVQNAVPQTPTVRDTPAQTIGNPFAGNGPLSSTMSNFDPSKADKPPGMV